MLEVAGTGEARRRLLLEGAGRAWASDRGLAVPLWPRSSRRVVGSWVSGSSRTRAAGRDYVDAAVARRTSSPSRPTCPAPSTTRAAGESVGGAGCAWPRLLAGGLPPALWFAARAQVAEVNRERHPPTGTSIRATSWATVAGVRLVDWEYPALSPSFTDVARIWSVLRSSADRDRLLCLALAGKSATEQRASGRCCCGTA